MSFRDMMPHLYGIMGELVLMRKFIHAVSAFHISMFGHNSFLPFLCACAFPVSSCLFDVLLLIKFRMCTWSHQNVNLRTMCWTILEADILTKWILLWCGDSDWYLTDFAAKTDSYHRLLCFWDMGIVIEQVCSCSSYGSFNPYWYGGRFY